MPNPLSPLFSDIFTDEKHKRLLSGLVQHFGWNCVEVFKEADTYSSAIKAFLSFYEANLDQLQAKNLFDQAGDLFEGLRAAEESHRESERLRIRERAIKNSALWSAKKTLVSNVNGGQTDETVIPQVYQASSEPVDDSNLLLQEEISSPLILEEELLSPEDQAKQVKREIVFKFLDEAKQIIAKPSGKSSEDIAQLVVLNKRYCVAEKDQSAQRKFRAKLVTYAAEGLVFPLKTGVTLSQYLASAQLNAKDKSSILMYCRFFRAVIKRHAPDNLPLAEYKNVITPLLNLLSKQTEALVTQQVSLFASLNLGKTLEVIYAQKPEKGEKAELMNRLAATVAIQNLPSFQLLRELYPAAERLFADSKFATTMQTVAALATNKDDLHTPLLLLLKVCVHTGETALADTVLRLFMALKKPSQASYNELQFLFSQDKSRQEMLQTFQALSNLPLDAFADSQAALWNAAKTDQQRKLITEGWLEKLAVYRDQLALSDELLAQRAVLDDEKTEGQPFVSLFDEVIKNTQKVALPSLTDLQNANSLIMHLLMGVNEEKAQIAHEYTKSKANYQSDLDALLKDQQRFCEEIEGKLTQLHKLRQQATARKTGIFSALEDIKNKLSESGVSNVESTYQAHLDAVVQKFALMEEITELQLQELDLTKKTQAVVLKELEVLRNDNEKLLPTKMRELRAKQQSFAKANQALNQLATQIQTQVDAAQKVLFEQAMLFKNAFGELVTSLKEQCEGMRTQQTVRQQQISEKTHRQAKIPLDLKACEQESSAVVVEIKAQKLKANQQEKRLGSLSKNKLAQVSGDIRQLSAQSRIEKSILNFIDLHNQAIANRRSLRYSAWALFKHRLAEWISYFTSLPNDWRTWANTEILSRTLDETLSREPRSLPLRVRFAKFIGRNEKYMFEGLVEWSKEVMDDHSHTLPREIRILTEELHKLEEINTELKTVSASAQSSAPGKQNGLFTGEIRTTISKLFGQSCDLALMSELKADKSPEDSKLYLAVNAETQGLCYKVKDFSVTFNIVAKEVNNDDAFISRLRAAIGGGKLNRVSEEDKKTLFSITSKRGHTLGQGFLIRDDKRASFLWRALTNRALDKFIEDNKQLNDCCLELSSTQAQIHQLGKADGELKKEIGTLEQKEEARLQKIEKLSSEQSQLIKDLAALETSQRLGETDSHALNEQYRKLTPLYEIVLSLVSSPVVDILYDKALGDEVKLNQLKKCIEDKSSLLRDGMGDGVCANLVYHAVRRGTVEMLSCILAALSTEESRCYLTTVIIDQGVANTPLALAVKSNQQDKINYLIKQHGVDFNQRTLDSNGNETTLLLWAYQKDQSETVASLIRAGADCQAKDSQGNTLLHCAAAKGDEAMILRFSGSESAITAKNQAGDDVLALLMKSNLSAEKKYNLMQKLFEHLRESTCLSAQHFMQWDEAGNNFLHNAAVKGDLPSVKWLLAQPTKALLNAKNQQDQTPLGLAVQAGQLGVVDVLFRQSVSLDGVKDVFLAALEQADTSEGMIKVFLTHNQVSFFSDIKTLGDDPGFVLRKLTQADQLELKSSSYRYLTACANFENMKLLVAHGADPCATDDLGSTVLHHAVLNGDLQKVRYLIEECGVEPHPQNNAGMTPLMALYETGKLPEGTHRQVVDYLIQRTPKGIVGLLGGQAAAQTHIDKKGNKLLHYVAQAGDVGVVKQLIPETSPYFGKNPLDHKNAAGETAVHLLVKNKALLEESVNTILGFLHSGGANLHLKDNLDQTPLDYATSFSVMTLLIGKLLVPLQDVRLMPLARRAVMASNKPVEEQKKSIEQLAIANKMNSTEAIEFSASVSADHYHSERQSGRLTQRWMDANVRSRQDYIASFDNDESGEKKHEKFTLMVNGNQAWEVACFLDSGFPKVFPEELNKEANAHLSFVSSFERRNFWVRVVEYREKKELTLQDYATGNTLLHALVYVNDKQNIFKLNETGVLYVTERDHKQKTVLTLAREKFPQDVKGQPSYTSFHTEDQSVYLSILQSIERRLVIERDTEIGKQIVAELDFSQLTELEMLLSLFVQFKIAGLSAENTEFLWKLTDKNGKFLAESALAVLNKDPSSERSQRLLIHLLTVSQVKEKVQSVLGDKLQPHKDEMESQIRYFIEESECKPKYTLAEAAIQGRMLDFGKGLSTKTGENVVSKRYESLCQQSVALRKPADSSQANRTTGLFGSVFAQVANETLLTSEQLQKHHAHNMVVYLGLFIEASGIDMLVTLPSGSSEPCASLLAVAREKQLPLLYVDIVGRVLVGLGLNNPIAMVEKAQTDVARKAAASFREDFTSVHGSALPAHQGASGVTADSFSF